MARAAVTKRAPSHLDIARRAFQIYVSRGGEHGHDMGDWLEAERQLLRERQPKKRTVKRT